MRPCIQATILFSFELRHRGIDHLVGGQQVAEAQLAVLEHLLDLFGACSWAQAEVLERHALRPGGRRACQASSTAPIAVPALPAAGCTNTFSNARALSSAETSSAFKPRPPARQRLRPVPAMRMTASLHGALHAGRDVRAQRFGNRGAVFEAEALVEARAEAAVRQPLGARRRSGRCAAIAVAQRHDFAGTGRGSGRRPRPRATALCARRRWRRSPAAR